MPKNLGRALPPPSFGQNPKDQQFFRESVWVGHTYNRWWQPYVDNFFLTFFFIMYRPAQPAELSRTEFDPELFSHSAYVKFFVTVATKVPYLTFCDKMRLFLVCASNFEYSDSNPSTCILIWMGNLPQIRGGEWRKIVWRGPVMKICPKYMILGTFGVIWNDLRTLWSDIRMQNHSE